MPIFMYRCEECGTTFSQRMSARQHDRLAAAHTFPGSDMAIAVQDGDVVRCPRCHDMRVQPLLVSSSTSASSQSDESASVA